MFPHLGPGAHTSPEAFFQRAERLRPDFFRVLYEEFIGRLVPEALTTYAATAAALHERFAEIWVLDGTRLDAVAHRLKLTWDVRSPYAGGPKGYWKQRVGSPCQSWEFIGLGCRSVRRSFRARFLTVGERRGRTAGRRQSSGWTWNEHGEVYCAGHIHEGRPRNRRPNVFR